MVHGAWCIGGLCLIVPVGGGSWLGVNSAFRRLCKRVTSFFLPDDTQKQVRG